MPKILGFIGELGVLLYKVHAVRFLKNADFIFKTENYYEFEPLVSILND